MIKEIFLPEKISGRRLFSQRIVGITIQEKTLTGCQIYTTPTGTTLEAAHVEPIVQANAENIRANKIAALKRLMAHFPRYDQLNVSLPSSQVVFKELTVPFTDPEKIRMIIEYEVEPLLPFSINQAIIDFIITKKDVANHSSQILVAAIQEKDVQEAIDLYQAANADPSKITIDLFALYGLYLQTPEYKNITKGSVLIDVGSTTTRVALLLNGELKLIRTIPRGIDTITTQVGADAKIPVDQVHQRLIDIGIKNSGDPDYDHIVEKHFVGLLNDIQFTLNSFSLKLNFYDEISLLLFTGIGSHTKDFISFAHQTLQITCEHFDCEKLFKTKKLKNKIPRPISSWNQYAIALATAEIYSEHDEFTFRRKSFAQTHHPLVVKQLVTAGVLFVAIGFALVGWGYWQITTFSTLKESREKEMVISLKKIFHSTSVSQRKTALKPLVNDAKREISKKRDIWQPFTQEDLQALEILYDLTLAIDKKNFIISVNKLNIHKDETGRPIVSIEGIFKSQTGELYKHFALFEEGMKTTKLLAQKSKEFDPAEDGTALSFVFKYKLKETEND